MRTASIGTKSAGTTSGRVCAFETGHISAVAVNVRYGQQVYTLPSWTQHGAQPSFWAETWRRKEMLADWDLVAGNVFETDDIEEMIRQLHEAAGE